MSYKHVAALAVGTLATSIGIVHFNPEREDEDGRYQHRILPEADALKAEKRGLVEIEGDADKSEFDAQQAGFVSARPAAVAAERLAEMDDAPRSDAAGTTPATAVLRNYPAGQGRTATAADPDAAPVPGGDEGSEEGGADAQPKILKQSIPNLKAALEKVDSVEELTALHDAEEKFQNRDGAKAVIDERKQALAAN